ncbi:acyltransferase family protein [Vibrio diazotrophicus]|uniref:acyltransferase family protein n=1 Tax=Vibrio diazotrophicus TaxID=685 RepID=UPI000C9E4619|nr:acyltransferase [Vibrio diazotrophicus]PNH93120.1 hypothetical protein C1M59_07890 [Vibrio diazotrophicus]
MTTPKNFHLLDLSRFIAAIAVLFWHYQHFYMIEGISFIREGQPLYPLFKIFYTHGYLAVQYFWILSGFVFFHTYCEKINKKKTNTKNYIANRFSRLYPLHILTLIVTALLAFYFKYKNGYLFVYQFNDIKHFLLNMFFISHWGLQDGYSYNAPIWSVSVEIFAYIVFFIYCRLINSNMLYTAIITTLTYITYNYSNNDLLYCVSCFFLGGTTYHIYKNLFNNTPSKKIIFAALIVFCAIAYYIHTFIFFASSVLLLSIIQSYNIRLGEKSRILGDLSFGVYLWHYPIQLVFVSFISQKIEFYNSSFTLLTFLSLPILASILSFYCYEKPVKEKLRSKNPPA